MIYYVIGTMGSGKTLYSTIKAIEYRKNHSNNLIYANYHLDIDNFIFNPLMVIPFDKMKDCMLIIDDIYALSNSDGLFGLIVNFSRKRNIDIIMTAQYYTMIPKQVRTLSDFEIRPNLKFDNKLLVINKLGIDSDFEQKFVSNPIEKFAKYYNTNEVVIFATEKKICKEILRISESKSDIEQNVELFGTNMTKRKRFKKIISEISDIEF